MIAHPILHFALLRALVRHERRTIDLGAPTSARLADPDRGIAQVAQRSAAELGASIGAMPRAGVRDGGEPQAAERGDASLIARYSDLHLLAGEASEVARGHRAQLGQRQVCRSDVGIDANPNIEVRQRGELEREPEIAGRSAVRGA